MPKPETTARRRAVLREAQLVIGREYRDPELSLADVASAVGVSPRQLQRIFREEAGEDFRRYVLRVRMEVAAELLSRERSPLPVRATARRVGYRQASGLRQAFLRFYGYNPSTIQPAPPEYLGIEVAPPAESSE
jgi:transcriptional regulator GlxA family with amidase domain